MQPTRNRGLFESVSHAVATDAAADIGVRAKKYIQGFQQSHTSEEKQ